MEDIEENIPSIEITGHSENQESTLSVDSMIKKDRGVPPGGLSQTPFTDAIIEIREGGVKGHAGMVLLQTLIRNLEQQISDLNDKNGSLSKKLEEISLKNESLKINNALLTERAKTSKLLRNISNLLITIGGVIAGGGLTDASSNYRSNIFIIVGIILLLLGWALPFFQNKNNAHE